MPVWDIGSLSNMQMRICVHCTNSFISSKKGVITFYMLIYINNYYHTLEIFIDLLSTPMFQWSNDPMVQMVQNGPKRSKTVQTVQNGPKCKNGPKLSDMVQNGPNFPYAFPILKFQKDTFFWDTLYYFRWQQVHRRSRKVATSKRGFRRPKESERNIGEVDNRRKITSEGTH